MNRNLLKVLIVDDEQNTRNLLKLCIDWDSLGMDIIGDADSGIEALDIMQETKPDIVLTDIEMPYMDGLMLSKQIMSQFIDVYVVILTAHEQFSYAQQAITIGVSDFILKPIDPELITNTLKKLARQINEKRKKLTQLENSYEYIKSNASQLKNQYFNALITGDTTTIGLIDKLDVPKALPSTLSNHTQIALINIVFDTYYNKKQSRQSITQNCIHYIEESFSDNQNLSNLIPFDITSANNKEKGSCINTEDVANINEFLTDTKNALSLNKLI
jgi:two-component system response regulator YesN